MPRAIDGATDRCDVGRDARRSLVVNDGDRLDTMLFVVRQPCFDLRCVDPGPPIALDKGGVEWSRAAIIFQSVANQPVSAIRTWSPGESTLTRAASQAPVPDAG